MKKKLFVVEKSNNDLFNNSQDDNNNLFNSRFNNNNLNLSNLLNYDNSNKNRNNNNNGMINNKKQIYQKNKETNVLMLEDNNIFNNIVNTITKFQINNQILFEHSFINSQTSCYVSFLEEPKIQNTIININTLIENRKGFEEFQISFDWEYYELILILASCKMNNELFEKYNEFIMIYLFNGMSKLNEINFVDNLKSNEKYCFEKLSTEVKKFYEQKEEDFRYNSDILIC